MEIKKASGSTSSRQRMHLIRRLAKAAHWGDLFSQLCSLKADARTALEAAVSDGTQTVIGAPRKFQLACFNAFDCFVLNM